MQLNRRTKSTRSNAQGIPFRTPPCAPFDDDCEPRSEKLLRERPLQRLNSGTAIFVINVERKALHPFVGAKADRVKPAFKRPRQGSLPCAGQSADDHQPCTVLAILHK